MQNSYYSFYNPGIIGMAVHHGKPALIVFRRHLSRRIRTEGAHLIIKGRRIENQLRFIQILIQELHDLVTHLHTHADIHRTRRCLYSDLRAFILEPVGTLTPYRRYYLICQEGIPFVRDHSPYMAVFHKNLRNHGIKSISTPFSASASCRRE